MQNTSETIVSPGRAVELAEKADAGIGQLSHGAHKAVDQIADSAAYASRELGRQGERLISAQRRLARASYQTMCRYPVASMVVAVVAGLLLGRMVGRQRHRGVCENAEWQGH